MPTLVKGRLQDARQHLETAKVKSGKNTRRKYLLKSVASSQLFIATHPIVRDWDTAIVLGNLSNSIATGIEDGETIPSDDVKEYLNALEDLEHRYNEHLSLEDDLEQAETAKVVETRSRVTKINATLKQSQMGLKALALVAGDLQQVMNTAQNMEENDERTVQASLNKFGRRRHAESSSVDFRDEEYIKLVQQMDTIEPYLLKMQNELPRKLTERFVVLTQPILVVGKPHYKPSARAQNFVARYGIEMGGYWILKNQFVLGVAKDVQKVVKNPQFRKSVADRLRAIYEEELEFRIKKEKLTRNQIHKARTDMEHHLRDDLEDEIALLSKKVDVTSLVKTLGKRFGYEVAQMPGTAFAKNSPYVYYWLVSTDMMQNVINGLYSEVTNWDLPYPH